MNLEYKEKYLKYKRKYLELKQIAGAGKCVRKTYGPCRKNDNCIPDIKNPCKGKCECNNFNCKCITKEELVKKKEFIKMVLDFNLKNTLKILKKDENYVGINNLLKYSDSNNKTQWKPSSELSNIYKRIQNNNINYDDKHKNFNRLLELYLDIDKNYSNSPPTLTDKIDIEIEVGVKNKTASSQLLDEDNNELWPRQYLPTVHGYFVTIVPPQEGGGKGKGLSNEELKECKRIVTDIQEKFKGNNDLDRETIDEQFTKLKEKKCPTSLYTNIKNSIYEKLEKKEKDEIEKEMNKKIEERKKLFDKNKNELVIKKEKLVKEINNNKISDGWVLTHIDDKHVYKLLSSPHPTKGIDMGWIIYYDQKFKEKTHPFKMKLTFENHYKDYVLQNKIKRINDKYNKLIEDEQTQYENFIKQVKSFSEEDKYINNVNINNLESRVEGNKKMYKITIGGTIKWLYEKDIRKLKRKLNAKRIVLDTLTSGQFTNYEKEKRKMKHIQRDIKDPTGFKEARREGRKKANKMQKQAVKNTAKIGTKLLSGFVGKVF